MYVNYGWVEVEISLKLAMYLFMCICSALLELFKNMSKNLGGIIVNKKLVVRLIGDKISGRLVETLVHECLTPAVPYELGDMPAFEELLALSDDFCAEMKVFVLILF